MSDGNKTWGKEALMEQAPLYAALSRYTGDGAARFHMPGHKGLAAPLREVFGDALSFDVTELPETDSLFEDDGAILSAEKLAARAYGVRDTLFSAGGSTLCIQAMLRAATLGGGRVICARNVHRSAVNALALLGVEPIWVWPRPFAGSGLPGAVLPADIETLALANPDATAVFITSPDYYGVMSDVAGISAVCRRHGLALLVDNAHGAHLPLLGERLHPAALGADLCCDSAHKTLPALTGAAFLHINSPRFSRGEVKAAMTLFGSTSPSYLIMLSLDLARAWMERDGKKEFKLLSEKVAGVREKLSREGYFTPEGADFDPVRLTVDTASRGVTGREAVLHLRKNGVSPEMGDGRHLVLLPAPFNPEPDFSRLIKALSTLPAGPALPLGFDETERPAATMALREAVVAQPETVDTTHSAGRVAAEAACPCPPCVPLVMPGELISAKMAISLKSYGVLKIKVVK